MKLELSAVPQSHVYTVVGGIAKHLETAAEYSDGRCSAADILRLVTTGQYLLWVVFDTETSRIHGFFVTEVKQYPQQKALVIQHMVVDPHLFNSFSEKLHDFLAAYAKDVGCKTVEFIGRTGWKKYAAALGMKTRAIVFEKTFK